jgi:adenylate cyclase class IV
MNMAEETEVKFEVDALEPYIEKLKKMAKCLADFYETVFYLDTYDGALEFFGKTLRLKIIGADEFVKVDIKQDAGESTNRLRIREEFGPALFRNSREAWGFLIALGYDMRMSYGKSRQHWQIADHNAYVELDYLPELNRCFVEIGGDSGAIELIADMLQLDWSKSTTKSYRTIVEENRRSQPVPKERRSG